MTVSAVYYVVGCLIDDPALPTNAGIFRPLRVVTEPGSLVDARFEVAVYETAGGGMGASGVAAGLSGVHVHMTNTLNTPAEALEYAYPLRVTRYELRWGSGGAGKHAGGDGLIREIELLGDATVTILSDRRRHAPYGLAGGAEGARGENRHLSLEGGERSVGGKASFPAMRGDRVRMETPGGGAFG